MPSPAYKDLINLGSNVNGLQPETLESRILTVLCMMASGSNPDGTTGGAAQAPLTLTSPSPSIIPLTIRAASGQTAYLLAVYDLNGVLRIVIGPDGTLYTSSVQIQTLPAFVSGDHYLVCDAAGNVHKSAIGPAS